MPPRRSKLCKLLCVLALLAASDSAWASDLRGVVTFQGLPVPGATVTATQGGRKYVTVTDTQGFYSFATLADGPASLDIELTGFAALKQDVSVAAEAPLSKFELHLLSLEDMRATLKPVPSAPFTEAQARSEPKKTAESPKPAANQPPAAPPSDEMAQKANDGLLVNGSVNNAATSQFTLGPRFGNTASGKSLYSYSLNVRAENSALDAQSYSVTGFQTSKPQTSQITGGFAFQGPLKIPHVLRNGPNIYIGYQRVENSVAVTTPGLVPDLNERSGNFAGEPFTVLNPATGQPFPGGHVPITPQAQALLALFPLPNVAGNTAHNYQIPLLNDTHVDALNSNVNKTVGRKNQFSGTFAASSNRTSFSNLFAFTDHTSGLGLNTSVNWAHTYNVHLRTNLGYQYSRQSTRITPYWQNRSNVSGGAQISGNDQNAMYWGPPTLNFASGITSLYDGNASFNRNQTNGVSYVAHYNHFAHNVSAGVDFRRQEFNYLTEANPRGTFSFSPLNPASSGSDVADFLLGIPYTSSIAYGNADKYLRQSVYDAYLSDDYRVNPTLTINYGGRWEYGAPVTETKNRLVNLDVASGFSAVSPVLASATRGSLTGQTYPASLTFPDRTGFEPRIGLSWRPIPGSSTVVSAGYGIYYDTSVYQGIALNMAQQAPLSYSFNEQYGAGCTLTLATFNSCGTTTGQTFGVDPGFRVGYLQTWNLQVRRDLPASLQLTATYLGNKGTRGAQLFLPNTNPLGAVNPCPFCPVGFEYLTSTGNSTRESGQIQLRRRLKSGLTASVLYTYSKSIDDDSALGGQGAATLSSATLAQNWRNLNGERGLSTFDQRHLLNVGVQYTTGMGKGGGTLLTGWRGKVYKEWTVQTQVNAGSGLPETPLASAVAVAGYTSFVRPNFTGASEYATSGGRHVNPLAFATPNLGQWGNARRDSITGPSEFMVNTALLRTFRLTARYNLDAQISAANALNHVSYSSYYTNINSPLFGYPAAAQTMRTVQTALRLRF